MNEQPVTSYATSLDGVSIAYQVTGDGPLDLVVVPPIFSHLEAEWEEFPQYRSFYKRLGRRLRVIRFDKRGVGLSDRIGDRVPTVEQRMDDIHAVMTAAGSEKAAIMGISEGGSLSILFCATHPERVTSLVLFSAISRSLVAPDYPEGPSPESVSMMIAACEETWGTGMVFSSVFVPSIAFDPRVSEAAARIERLAATPRAIRAALEMNVGLDVRETLALVRVPALVMQRRYDSTAAPHGRYMAEHIPGAAFVEYQGADHVPWSGNNADQVADDIEEFLTGEQAQSVPDIDRVLATVMFTDIVDSTRTATALGDRRWRDLLDRHDDMLREQIDRFGGRLVKTTGDGCLATFDGPGRAIRCATLLRDTMRASGIDIRAGLHAGEVEIRGEDIGGIAVHIGSRVAGVAGPDEVLVSRTVVDLVAGSGIVFEDRGDHELKGVPGTWKLFAVGA